MFSLTPSRYNSGHEALSRRRALAPEISIYFPSAWKWRALVPLWRKRSQNRLSCSIWTAARRPSQRKRILWESTVTHRRVEQSIGQGGQKWISVIGKQRVIYGTTGGTQSIAKSQRSGRGVINWHTLWVVQQKLHSRNHTRDLLRERVCGPNYQLETKHSARLTLHSQQSEELSTYTFCLLGKERRAMAEKNIVLENVFALSAQC
jgi:hypothetical protein